MKRWRSLSLLYCGFSLKLLTRQRNGAVQSFQQQPKSLLTLCNGWANLIYMITEQNEKWVKESDRNKRVMGATTLRTFHFLAIKWPFTDVYTPWTMPTHSEFMHPRTSTRHPRSLPFPTQHKIITFSACIRSFRKFGKIITEKSKKSVVNNMYIKSIWDRSSSWREIWLEKYGKLGNSINRRNGSCINYFPIHAAIAIVFVVWWDYYAVIRSEPSIMVSTEISN